MCAGSVLRTCMHSSNFETSYLQQLLILQQLSDTYEHRELVQAWEQWHAALSIILMGKTRYVGMS